MTNKLSVTWTWKWRENVTEKESESCDVNLSMTEIHWTLTMSIMFQNVTEWGWLMHNCHLCTWDAEAGGLKI